MQSKSSIRNTAPSGGSFEPEDTYLTLKGRKMFSPGTYRRAASIAASAVVAAMAALTITSTASASGELSQGSGRGICFHEPAQDLSVTVTYGVPLATKKGFCKPGKGLQGATDVAISPDGKNVYVAADHSGTVSVFRRDRAGGRLRQLPGKAGCVSDNTTTFWNKNALNLGEGVIDKHRPIRKGVCAKGRGLSNAQAVAVSADGRNVYVAGYHDAAIAVFARNPTTGKLTQRHGAAGCIADGGRFGCARGHALYSAYAFALSPDGRQVYAGTYHSDAVVVLRRNPKTGALTQSPGAAGCVAEDGDHGCASGRGLKDAIGVSVSPDGKQVYVAGFESNAIAIFDRDARTGALTQAAGTAGCLSEGGEEGCAPGRGLNSPERVLVSADGRNVYATGLFSASVVSFDRDRESGALTQRGGDAGCISAGKEPGCGMGRSLREPSELALSPDGRNLYVANAGSLSVATFDRDRATGRLTQRRGRAGCTTEIRSRKCHVGQGLLGATGIKVSPDGKNVYVASFSGHTVTTLSRH
jgi:DNA-binding beta-propeller fold protein YncE